MNSVCQQKYECTVRVWCVGCSVDRVVRLMTANALDCMDVVAEFLFVLCKENGE